MKLDISIIIPAYNASKTISQTIESCLGQDYPLEKLEIIIVDDGSADDTKEIVKKHRVKYIYQKNGGPAKARNTGWKSGKGEIICFTDADCIPERSWISKLVKNYSSGEVAAAGGSYGIENEESLFAACIYREIVQRHSKMPTHVRALGSYNLSVKRSVLEDIGGFDEGYRMASGEDNDLSYKMIKKGYHLIFDRDIRVSHYHPDKLSKYLRDQFWHGYWRVKLYSDYPNMARGDDYSNIWDFVQPPLCLITLFLIPFVWFFPVNLILVIFLTLEVSLQLPIALPIIRINRQIKYLMLILITFLRGFARGMGMLLGIWRFATIRKGKTYA